MVSYIEIYMERVRDLLNPVNDNLSVREDKRRGVYIQEQPSLATARCTELSPDFFAGCDRTVRHERRRRFPLFQDSRDPC